MIKLSINLSKIPKDKITTSKSGDKWVNLIVWENKEPDKFENTHSVTMSKKDKDEPSVYVGNGKAPGRVAANSEPSKPKTLTQELHDSLPF